MTLDAAPFLLTFRLAGTVTLILALIGIPLAYACAFAPRRWKYIIAPLVSLPLVLPPTVLGFYLLLLLGPHAPLGHFLEETFHIRAVFSFTGLVIGSVIFSLPFMVNPLRAGLESFPRALMEASYVLGKSKLETLFRVILPNIRPALLTGIVMAFAHTVGEFGVVLMLGGNIPGETRTASIALFDEAEVLNFKTANAYAGILFCLSFIILFVLNIATGKAADVSKVTAP